MFRMTEHVQSDLKQLSCRTAFFVLVLLCVSVAFAQDRDDVIRIDTDLATFEVTVSDKSGKPVRNLKSDEFKIYEDGVERSIDFFQPLSKQDRDRPLSVVFALDVSGSMTEPEIDRLRSGMQGFIARLADYDSYFAVISFAMDVRTLQSFTNKREKLERSFDKIVRDQDGLSTHAYDAVDEAVRLIARKGPKIIRDRIPKRAVVIVTDGFPVGDVVSPRTLIERANDAETSVYSVILPSYSRLQVDKRPVITPLEASGLIERTGGKSFYATEKSFNSLFEALAEEITASYAIAFYPDKPGVSGNGKKHQVTIRSKSGYNVRQNRTGYDSK
jgi:Ca-activated chloride channel homolog